jgi:hypothetical protein
MARIPLWVGLTVVGLSAMWIALGSLILPSARSHDFLNIYTGASLAREGHFADLHDPDVQLARERRIFPQLPSLVPFVRPAFYAALLMPLALLPYGTAFVVWIAAQSLLLLACWAWSWRRFGPDALVFAALFLSDLAMARGTAGRAPLAHAGRFLRHGPGSTRNLRRARRDQLSSRVCGASTE